MLTNKKVLKTLKKMLTNFDKNDNIKKSLEGDRRKWSLKIEQINIKLSNNQQFFLRVSE